MVFAPNQFRSIFKYDGARPNIFECRMNFPPFATSSLNGARVGTDNLSVTEQFSFYCRAAQLPGSTVNPVPVYYFGREIKVAGNPTYPEWTVTIINDEDFKVRNAFELWMNGLNQHRRNLRDESAVQGIEYQRDAYVIQYGKTGEPIRSYTFIGVFPIDISPIELDWGANDTIEEYAVTFAVQWWESTLADQNGTGSSPPLNNVPIF